MRYGNGDRAYKPGVVNPGSSGHTGDAPHDLTDVPKLLKHHSSSKLDDSSASLVGTLTRAEYYRHRYDCAPPS